MWIQNEQLIQTPVKTTLNGKSVFMAENTTIQDVIDENYILFKSEESGCTRSDYELYNERKHDYVKFFDTDSVETQDLVFETTTKSPSEQFTGYGDSHEFLSTVAQRLQSNIEQSIEQSIQHIAGSSTSNNGTNDSANNFDLMTNQSLDDIRKSIFPTVDQVLSSSRMPAVLVNRFEERAKKELQEVDTRLSEYKRELHNDSTAGCPVQGGVISDRSTFEFAFDDHKCVRKEKRKRNGLDY
jgi:hypothetical protein